MPKLHPCDNTLAEYSAGSLEFAHSICVSAHLDYCADCRRKVAQFNTLGAEMLINQKQATTVNLTFDQLMAAIQAAPEIQYIRDEQNDRENAWASELPKVVQRLLPKQGKLKWKVASPSLREAKLETGQNKSEVSLYKIRRGGNVAEHNHKGREVTLVLEGAFSDSVGTYNVGDYVVREAGEIHRPIATQDRDCLCLSVLDAPLKLTGMMGALVNPFLSFQPR